MIWLKKIIILLHLDVSYECTERIFDSQPFMYSNIFLKKTLLEVYSSHLYASFGTFCEQIGQLFEAQWDLEVCLEIDKENVVDFGILPKLPVQRIVDQFGHKRCQKKREDVDYKLH